MSSFPNPLPTITAADLLMAIYGDSGDLDKVRRMGEGLREAARERSLRADERRFLKRAGVPGPPFEGTGDEPGTPSSPLSPEYAQELFDYLKALDYIPFDYPADGCYARAHEMARVLQEREIQCAKVWNHSAGSPLVARNDEFGEMRWDFHVAVVVCVTGPDGDPVEMVIDPSLAQTPVPVDEWVALQNGPDGQRSRVTSAEPYKYQPTNPGSNSDMGTIWMDPGYEGTRATLESFSVQRDLIRVGRQIFPPEDAPTEEL